MNPYITRFDEEFRGLLQFLFITTKKYDMKVTAAKMGVDYGTFYSWVSGKRTFPAPMLPLLADATGDRIFLDAIFAGTGWKVVKKIEEVDEYQKKDLIKESMELVEKLGYYYESLKRTYEDMNLTSEEKNELKVRLSEIEKELDKLRDIIFALK